METLPLQQQVPIQPTSVDSSQQPTRLNPFWTVLFIILGLILGSFGGIFYEGRWFISRILLLGREPLLAGDRIVPPGIGFNFSHNIKQIPEEVFGYSQETTRLIIRGGRMTRLPAEIGSLSILQTLEVSENRLETVPPEVGNLAFLEILNLGANELSVLSPVIGNLTNLKKLYLYNNQLEVLPDEIGYLTSLETLDLRSNSLQSLPSTIGNLTNLKILYLGGNRISQQEAENIQNLLPNATIYF